MRASNRSVVKLIRPVVVKATTCVVLSEAASLVDKADRTVVVKVPICVVVNDTI